MNKTQRRKAMNRIDALSRLVDPTTAERIEEFELRRDIHVADGTRGALECAANCEATLAKLRAISSVQENGNSPSWSQLAADEIASAAESGSWTRSVYPSGQAYREPVK